MVEETGDRFTATCTAICVDEQQSFVYRTRITGSAYGTLRFEGAGTPETDFLTNRTRFVVLHGGRGAAGRLWRCPMWTAGSSRPVFQRSSIWCSRS